MIWQGIIGVITAVLMAIITLLPLADPVVVTRITDGLTPFKTMIATADWLFPVASFFAIIKIMIGVEAVIIVVKIIHWVAKTLSVGLLK